MKKSLFLCFILSVSSTFASNADTPNSQEYSYELCIANSHIETQPSRSECNRRFLENVLQTTQKIETAIPDFEFCNTKDNLVNLADIQYNYLKQFELQTINSEGLSGMDVFSGQQQIFQALESLSQKCP